MNDTPSTKPARSWEYDYAQFANLFDDSLELTHASSFSRFVAAWGLAIIDRLYFSLVLPPVTTYYISNLTMEPFISLFPLLMVTLYFCVLFSVTRILGLVHYRLAIITEFLLLMYTWFGPGELIGGILLLVLFIRDFTWGSQPKEPHRLPVTCYGTIASRHQSTSEDHIGMWILGLLTLVAGIISVKHSGPEWAVLAVAAALIFFFQIIRVVPNVGGNSLWSNLPILVVALMCLMVALPLFAATTTVIFDTMNNAQIRPEVRRDIGSPWIEFMHTVFRDMNILGPFLERTETSDLLLAAAGSTFFWGVVFDKIIGPGHTLGVAISSLAKRPDNTPVSFVGAFLDPWIPMGVITLLIDIFSGRTIKLAASVIGIVFGWLLFFFVFAPVRSGSGVGLVLTRLRGNRLVSFGDGSSGIRVLVGFFFLLAVTALKLIGKFALISYNPYLCLVDLLLLGSSWGSRKVLLGTLAYVTGHTGLLFTALFDINADMRVGNHGVILSDVGQDMVGANSSSAPKRNTVPFSRALRYFRNVHLRHVEYDLGDSDMAMVRDWSKKAGCSFEVRTSLPPLFDEHVIFYDDGTRGVGKHLTQPPVTAVQGVA